MRAKINKNKTNVQHALKELKRGSGQLSIDETDRKILRLLAWDSRISYRGIARRLKISTGTVIERLKKLKTNQVIKGYSVSIDDRKLGYEITAIVELTAPQLIKQKALYQIKEMPNVYGIYHTTGDIDAVILAKFKSIDELHDFLENTVYAQLDIQKTETRIVFETVKEDFRALI